MGIDISAPVLRDFVRASDEDSSLAMLADNTSAKYFPKSELSVYDVQAGLTRPSSAYNGDNIAAARFSDGAYLTPGKGPGYNTVH